MATISIGEAMSLINGILDKVANEAEQYMKDYIDGHTKDATGALRDSIYNVKRGENARAIGSKLSYAQYVNNGRGPVKAKHKTAKGGPGYLRFEIPRGGEVFYRHEVKAAKGIHFIEETAKHIGNMPIKL